MDWCGAPHIFPLGPVGIGHSEGGILLRRGYIFASSLTFSPHYNTLAARSHHLTSPKNNNQHGRSTSILRRVSVCPFAGSSPLTPRGNFKMNGSKASIQTIVEDLNKADLDGKTGEP